MTTQFLTDEQGQQVAVVISMADYESLMGEVKLKLGKGKVEMGRKIVEGLKVAGLKVGERRKSFGLGMGVSDSLTFDF